MFEPHICIIGGSLQHDISSVLNMQSHTTQVKYTTQVNAMYTSMKNISPKYVGM